MLILVTPCLALLYFLNIRPESLRIESCQCRKARIQRNHIACAILVWLRLKDLAYKSGQTIYKIKHGLLSNYLIQQLKRPNVPMFAF